MQGTARQGSLPHIQGPPCTNLECYEALPRSATGSVCELSTPNPPIGIFKEQKFASSHVEFSSGDIAVLLTDGLTEAANENEEEYGLERVKQQVTKYSEESLKVLCEMLLAETRKFGKQMDDQSVLLVRRL